MIDLRYFIIRACADARLVAKRGQDSCAGSGSSPDRPAPSLRRATHHTPDDDPPGPEICSGYEDRDFDQI